MNFKEYRLKAALEQDPKLKRAIAEHDGWAKHTFGGLWQGVIYAVLVYMTIAILGATGGNYLLALWVGVTTIVGFWAITKYDKLLVSLWNQRELEDVVTKYTLKNLDSLLPPLIDDEYPIDSTENLDGTKGDE